MNGLILTLNNFAITAAKRAELVAAGIVIAIVLMLVLPMPIWLLDILIAVNLCSAGLIVVVSMYMNGPTAFSSFPAVLLLTTLFRLAIEVATTRLILLEAEAGHIVETFGNFVVGGNLVVGLVIFLILTVVQFIVITKGSERVSEVIARFTLDAMPGKQMSIDSDLRAGLISAEEAKAKRAELGKESQMHGAMDGAMKFVKGDAIAGIFIVAVNLIGGIAIGVLQRDLTASEAMRVYSVLSIGDALIAQIPGLLISLAAGMITTRVSNEINKNSEDGNSAGGVQNIGQQIASELFREPKALVTLSVIMVLFGLIPGMPTSIFMVLAVLLAVGGAVGILAPYAKQAQKVVQEKVAAPKLVDVVNFAATKPLQLLFPEALSTKPEAEVIQLEVRRMRNRILEKRGIPDFPLIDMVIGPHLSPNTICFQMVEVPLVTSEVKLGWGATLETSERLTDLGIEHYSEEIAGSRRKRMWIKLNDEESLQKAGVAWERWESVFAADVEIEMLRNCQLFVGVQESQRFTRWAEQKIPEFNKEFTRAVTSTRLAEILQRLVRENISLRNVRLLLESIYEWAQKERDPDLVADYVRLAFKRQICHQIARDGLIQAVLLSPELEDAIRNSIRRSSMGSYLDLDQDTEQTFLDKLADISGTWGTQRIAPVLVTTADIRRQVRRLIEEEFFGIEVLAFTELSSHYRVQPIGMIEI